MTSTTTTTTTALPDVQRQEQTTPIRSPLNESLTGLLFVAPAALLALIFQLFPVLYGFFLGMQGGIALPEGFVGLDHFTNAIGSLAYMIGLALALVLGVSGVNLLRRGLDSQEKTKVNFQPYLVPALFAAPSTIALFMMIFFGDFTNVILPIAGLVIAIAGYVFLNARNNTEEAGIEGNALVNSWGGVTMLLLGIGLLLFVLSEINRSVGPLLSHLLVALTEVLTSPRDKRVLEMIPLTTQFACWAGIFVSGFLVVTISRIRSRLDSYEHSTARAWLGLLRLLLIFILIGLVIYNLVALDLINGAVAAMAKVAPERIKELSGLALKDFLPRLLMWPEVSTMLFGISSIALAYIFWKNATKRETAPGMMAYFGIAVLLLIGGWLFVGELPTAASSGDPLFYQSLLRTVLYAVFTVPIQLAIGLLLAYLLYHEVTWGKGLFRVVFFIPYIAPTVATAAVFTLIFGGDQNGYVNQLFKAVGIPIQQWTRDPRGIFEIIYAGGKSGFSGTTPIPSILTGPSLPLISAILFSIWVFSGYNAVIFMSGLAAVPKEMYEAAEVDGAGRWGSFRHITIPLISPTTFFLTLLAITGTFRAFTHIYVLRNDSMRGALDVATVYIYQIIRDNTPSRPYAAALSFILFGIILVLTVIQNRATKDQVFYG
ncbi:MAG: sugar ABC transporter permease [Anaerolineae bacterium]|nr:sugar ABC transporter permease [Anaerolineae bacterium]